MVDLSKIFGVVKTIAADRRVIAAVSALAAKSVYAKVAFGVLFSLLGVQ
jgi:hypothetical protein